MINKNNSREEKFYMTNQKPKSSNKKRFAKTEKVQKRIGKSLV